MQRIVEGQFDHFEILALCFQAAAMSHAYRSVVLGDEKMQLLRNRTGAHIRFENLLHVLHAIPRFLFSFGADPLFWQSVVEQSPGSLDHHAVMAIDEHWKPELPGQHDGLLVAVE